MKKSGSGYFKASARVRVAVAVAISATVLAVAGSATAGEAVEYVRICDLYGAGFFYAPGTETCVNSVTNDARQQTEGGTWRWRSPSNPHQWVKTPKKACKGKLVKFGDIDNTGLALNEFARYETSTRFPVALQPGQYISAVVYKGGFTGVGTGNFCLFYTYEHPTNGTIYSPLGCIDTARNALVPAALSFATDAPLPPVTDNPVSIVGANGTQWNVPLPEMIGGSTSIWLCVEKAAG